VLGAPASVPAVSNLAELLAHWARVCPERAAAYFLDLEGQATRLGWGELHAAAMQGALALSAQGVVASDRVLLALPTSAELLIAFFACQWLGALPCIVDVPARGRGLRPWCDKVLPKLALVKPRLVIVEPGLATDVQAGLAQAEPGSRVISVAALAEGAARFCAPTPGASAILQFTSGTTSQPKAVVCTQRAVLANLRAIGGGVRQFHQGDLMVGWLPLFHDMGLVATTLAALAHGLPAALMPPAAFVLRPARWLWAVHRFRASLAFAPNFAYRLCVRRLAAGDPELSGLDLSSWRCAFNAAEFIHADTARSFSTRFAPYGLPLHAITPAYGMAEMAVGVSSRPFSQPLRVDQISRAALARDGEARRCAPGDDALDLVSLGRVFDEHELQIHDAHGRPLPERHEGEIVLRGPSLFEGYYQNPDATRAVLRDGWLRTGDLGYLAEGEVYITGRSKDVIIRGGENHHPHLLEEAAGAVAGVRAGRVAAVGLASAAEGTEQVALLVETGETSSEAQQRMRREIELSVQRASGLKPDHVVLVRPNTVPITTSGKIRRASAREAILRELSISSDGRQV
jgi:acyl-CoA synthetase (AMP-forming)/AMP-acid ligase II